MSANPPHLHFTFHRKASDAMLAALEPHHAAIVAMYTRAGLVLTARQYDVSPASLWLVLLVWMGKEPYEQVARHHRAKRGGVVLHGVRIQCELPVRRWAEFSIKERELIEVKTRAWFSASAMALRRHAALLEIGGVESRVYQQDD